MEEYKTWRNQLTEPDQALKLAAEYTEPSQRIMRETCERLAEKSIFQPPSLIFIGQAFMEFSNWMVADLDKLVEAQAELI